MKVYKKQIAAITLVIFLISFSGLGQAAGDLPDTFVAMPIRVVSVKGDAAKFRALHWMNDGATGGIKELGLDRKLGKDEHVSFEGHAVPGDNDLGGLLTVTKDNVGYYKIDYGTFRKWYDNVGGNYPAYSTLVSNRLENSDLHLDIGHFLVEAGAGPIDDPKLSFTYERDTKLGDKSRLSWINVVDIANSISTTKKTAPSWERMDQTTDTLTLKGKTEVKGFTLKGQAGYEFFNATNYREYNYLATQSVSTNDLSIRQTSLPQTKLLTSTLMADRWSVNDQTYVALGYHFGHNRSTENIMIRTFNYFNNALGGTIYKDGFGQNTQDTHTWTGQLMSGLTPHLNFTTKVKAEIVQTKSWADYYSDTTTPPDGVYNTIDRDSTENKILRTGEGVSLRYDGIAKTSLYAESEMSQEHNWISENRIQTGFQGTAATSVSREEVSRNPTFVETVGARYVPSKHVNMTTQYKHTFGGQTFDTLWKSDPTALNRDSFFNKMNIDTDEIAAKVSWKPLKWMEHSVKYKAKNYVYHTNAVTEDWEKAQMYQQDYIYDLTLIPTDALMFNLSYSLENLKASTRESQIPDSTSNTTQIPVFTANVYSWMFTTSYAPKDNFSIYNSIEYSRAKNPNNAYTTTSSLRYGVDDQWWDMTFGAKWSPKKNKNITVEPHYAYYSFRANQSIESGNYSAHVLWLDLKYNW